MLTYILTITPESEATKPTSKRTLKSATLQLKSDEPWSTLEAQLLVKISTLLKPKRLNYEDSGTQAAGEIVYRHDQELEVGHSRGWD
jgi:hypothetical protein